MAWLAKGFDGLSLIILYAFYRQSVLIALQKADNASILKCTIIVGEGFFRLTILLVFPSPPFFYMLLVIGGGFGT
jgi:hypothetical protein